MKVDLKILNSKIRAETIQFLLERYLSCLIAIEYSLSEIARGIGCSKGALVYALRDLEAAGVVRRSKKKGRLNIRLNPSHVLIARMIEAELLGIGTLQLDLGKEVQAKVAQLEKEHQECQRRVQQLEAERNMLRAGIKQGELITFVKGLAKSIVEEVRTSEFATPKALEAYVADVLMDGLMEKFAVFVGG
ncbi:MAG: hypothetical protein ACE5R6_06270 [Candidatus Heimdallarchaeota archaeon]